MDTVAPKSLNIPASTFIRASPICLISVGERARACRCARDRLPFAEQGNIETALRKGFIEFDREMALDEDMREDLAGTTAICVVIKDDKLFCGNVGDSRAIASVNGNVEALSTDHKPNNDEERKRITAAGGWVEFNRVNGTSSALTVVRRTNVRVFFFFFSRR